MIDMMEVQLFLYTEKSISVNILHMILQKAFLYQLCGDIGNNFMNVDTKEKAYIHKSGPEFCKFEGCFIILIKALYGLCYSSEIFQAHPADTIQLFGFCQTCFDNYV